MNTKLFPACVLLILCGVPGCGDVNYSVTADLSEFDISGCYLDVNNKDLDEVAETFAEKLEASVVLADGVDGAAKISTKITADTWEKGLESLASELSMQLEHDATTNTYTLSRK